MKFGNPFSSIDKLAAAEEENKIYEKIANDIDKNIIDKGIWTKAFSKSEGNLDKQKAIYIELMFQHYKKKQDAEKEIEKVEIKKPEPKKETKEKINTTQKEIRTKENLEVKN